MNDTILELKDISKFFAIKGGLFKCSSEYLKAVNRVNLSIRRGESLGLVGESGCGKTTLAKIILNLYKPTSGKIFYDGEDITALSKKEQMHLRTKIQIVFQDPFSSLNPRMNIGDIIGEPLLIHSHMDRKERMCAVHEVMDRVGLNTKHCKRYPHEFSGGQRQRIMIAKALILKPEILVCDEAVSALDVSIQSQILNLLIDLKKELNLTLVFISHNLTVVDYICDRIVVMYLGKIVEIAIRDELYANPMHPYVTALLSAIPIADPTHTSKRIILQGEVPSPVNPPRGCAFRNRCWNGDESCLEMPELIEVRPDHFVACRKIR